MKTCARCGESKPEFAFYHADTKSGLMSACRECHCARVRENAALRRAKTPSLRRRGRPRKDDAGNPATP